MNSQQHQADQQIRGASLQQRPPMRALEIIIIVAPKGTARCLWTETVPLHELGHLDIQRATAIEFDNSAQAWWVFDGYGDQLYCSPSREICLAWEHKHLNWVLENS